MQSFFKLTMNLRGGAVGIVGEQQCVAASVHVGNIHRAVGADQAVPSLRDQDTALAAHDAAALPDGEFDHASIELVAPCPSAGREGWPDFSQIDELPLRLGDDFVFDDQNVALTKLSRLQGIKQESEKGIAGLDLGLYGQRDDADLLGRGT